MMAPVVKAERTLFWALVTLVVATALVEAAQRDLARSKAHLRDERNRRASLQDDVDALRADLDAALDYVNEIRAQQEPPADAPADA